MRQSASGTVRFGPHTLDLDRGLLTRSGKPVHIRAKTFALLSYLATHSGRVVPKDELIDAIWPETTVTDDSLTQTIRDLRRALADDGASRIQTVARRGYLFATDAADAVPTSPGPGRLPLLAVLPFLLPPDPADAALVDGIVEEVTHGVARYGQVRVIARHSAFRFRAETTPPAEAAIRLGTDYFVEGTARRIGPDLLIAVALCETAQGSQIWGESFALPGTSLRELKATIPHRIVSRLSLDVERSVTARPLPSGTIDTDAFRHFVRAVSHLRKFGEAENVAARDHLLLCIALDPDFALAHAYLGLAEIIIGGQGAASAEVKDRALSHATHAVQCAPDEARCHWILSIVRLMRREFAASELNIGRALDLNPHDPDLMAWMGLVLAMRGQPERGLDWLERARELNPLHPDWYHTDMAITLQMLGRYREAIAQLQCLPPHSPWHLSRLAACHAMAGDAEAAARCLARAEALHPGWDAAAELRKATMLEHEADIAQALAEIGRALAARSR